MERVTSVYAKPADATFDENQELAKRKAITPTALHRYMAIVSRRCEQYAWLVGIAEAQIMDPLAGLAIGETQPGISGLNEEWSQDHVW